MTKNNYDPLDRLTKAAAGLLWRSESDFPFEVFSWSREGGEVTNSKVLLDRIHRSEKTPIKEIDLQNFFAPAIREKDWHDFQERETVKKYRHLLTTIEQNLNNIKVYLVGKIEIKVYIIGELPDRDWGVLFTTMVQT